MSTIDATTAAERLGVRRQWLLDQARARHIPHLKAGRYIRFTEEHLDQILASWTVAPVEENPYAPTDRSQARRRTA